MSYLLEIEQKTAQINDYLKRIGSAQEMLTRLSKRFIEDFHKEIKGISGNIEVATAIERNLLRAQECGGFSLLEVRGLDEPDDVQEYGMSTYEVSVSFLVGGERVMAEPQGLFSSPHGGFEHEGFVFYTLDEEGCYQPLAWSSKAIQRVLSKVLDDYLFNERYIVSDLYAVENPLPASQWVALWSVLGISGTPLHGAAEAGALDLIEALLDEGFADIDAKNALGATPLMVAVKQARVLGPGAAELLIRRGADVSLKDDEGLTAFERAKALTPDDTALTASLESLALTVRAPKARAADAPGCGL